MENITIVGESPVYEIDLILSSILSITELEKFCVNSAAPSAKAKYS